MILDTVPFDKPTRLTGEIPLAVLAAGVGGWMTVAFVFGNPAEFGDALPTTVVSFIVTFLVIFRFAHYYFGPEIESNRKMGFFKRYGIVNNRELTLDWAICACGALVFTTVSSPTWWFLCISIAYVLNLARCETTKRRHIYLEYHLQMKTRRGRPEEYEIPDGEDIEILDQWIGSDMIYFALFCAGIPISLAGTPHLTVFWTLVPVLAWFVIKFSRLDKLM